MPHQRWNRAKQVFHEALDKTGPARARFVAVACADDADLRAQVEALLAAHDEAGPFMASPTGGGPDDVAQAAATLAAAVHPESPGTRVGAYRLLQVIGEGGFGVVYMAEQEHPIRRRVALKIIKLGMDTKEVIARFEAERQALALMDHPNIAKVFDAGATESGRPYFVMELVKGVPITDYCDANHVATRERLDLFADVCKAIHHAHEKGIIHRDIKPSNVMVTLHDGTPVPKIIDFGVAKATNQRLTEKTLFTAFGEFVGTPAYMSPEQTELSGLEIDRRSDVYSLGVLLYEMLTGTTPFEAENLRARGFVEMMRIIREEDPPTPSARLHTLGSRLIEVAGRRQAEPAALKKLVRGDLDWIVMKALDKDRRRRYGTASEFVDDLGRYVRDEPVTARRPSAGYRLRKYARRRRGTIAAAASVAGAVALGGFVAMLGQPDAVGPDPTVMRTLPFTEVDDALKGTRRDFQGLSPDGAKALLGDYTQGENFGVYDLSSRAFSLLTRFDWSTHWVCCGAWSPRGDSVAYQRAGWSPNEPVEVHVTSLEGQSRMIFRHDRHPGEPVIVAGWMPDASRVLVRVSRMDGSGAIGTIPASGGAFTQIRAGKWGGDWNDRLALSPDGRFIAFAEPGIDAARDIRVLSVDDRREYLLTDHPADDSKPLWSPDGRHLAFISTRGGASALWAVAMNSGQPAGPAFKLKDGMQDARLLNWDARGIVFGQDKHTFDIFTSVREKGAGGPWPIPRQLSYEHTGRNVGATWSPNSAHIAFFARDLAESGRVRHVIVKPAAGGVTREYLVPETTFPLPVPTDLRWFGDGKGLGFSGRDPKGDPALYKLTLATGEWQVTSLDTEAWTPIEWNADGSACYLVRARPSKGLAPGIYERDIETGTERPLYRPAERFGVIRHLRFSANRQWLAFLQVQAQGRTVDTAVLALNLATGEYRTLTTIHSARGLFVWGFAWAPGDSAVALLVDTSAGRSELRLAPLDGGGVRVAQDLTLPPVGADANVAGFDWSPDGQRLAFVVWDAPSRAFIIENPLADAPASATTARR